MCEFTCFHQGHLFSAPQISGHIEEGLLQIDGEFFCSSKIPPTKSDLVGQSITCVGPCSPLCPHPDVAVRRRSQ